MKNRVNKEIFEAQEKSEKEDEVVFKLLIDGKTASLAKTTLHNTLDNRQTTCKEKCKGYGTKLLAFMEKKAKAHCSTSIKTSNFYHCKK